MQLRAQQNLSWIFLCPFSLSGKTPFGLLPKICLHHFVHSISPLDNYEFHTCVSCISNQILTQLESDAKTITFCSNTISSYIIFSTYIPVCSQKQDQVGVVHVLPRCSFMWRITCRFRRHWCGESRQIDTRIPRNLHWKLLHNKANSRTQNRPALWDTGKPGLNDWGRLCS